MSEFHLDGTPIPKVVNTLFMKNTRSEKLTQEIFSMLQANPHRQYSIVDLAEIFGASYLSVYRACGKICKLRAAKRVEICWPMSKSGRETIMNRVGVEYRPWFSEKMKSGVVQCPFVLQQGASCGELALSR
jgi:hypothetical protein